MLSMKLYFPIDPGRENAPFPSRISSADNGCEARSRAFNAADPINLSPVRCAIY